MEKLDLVIITIIMEFKCAIVICKNGNISAQFLLGEPGKEQVLASNTNTAFCSCAQHVVSSTYKLVSDVSRNLKHISDFIKLSIDNLLKLDSLPICSGSKDMDVYLET